MTQKYSLTADEMSALFDGGSTVAGAVNAAYALSIQRARKVKPLEWRFDADAEQWFADSRSYEDGHAVWKGRDGNWYTRMENEDHMFSSAPTPFHATEESAKNACFLCHAEFVLSQLEDYEI